MLLGIIILFAITCETVDYTISKGVIVRDETFLEYGVVHIIGTTYRSKVACGLYNKGDTVTVKYAPGYIARIVSFHGEEK
jgi:hypothetical protein